MLFILRWIVNNKKVVSLPIPPSTHQLVCAEAPCAISCFVLFFLNTPLLPVYEYEWYLNHVFLLVL